MTEQRFFEVGGERLPAGVNGAWPVAGTVSTVAVYATESGGPVFVTGGEIVVSDGSIFCYGGSIVVSGGVDVKSLSPDNVHQKIIDGLMFSSMHTFLSVPNNGTALLSIIADVKLNAIFCVSAGGAGRAYLDEGGSVSAGNSVSVWNMNRSSNIAPVAICKYGATHSGGTPIVDGQYVPGGEIAANRVGGRLCEDIGYILNENTNYSISFVNISGVPSNVTISFTFYEMGAR